MAWATGFSPHWGTTYWPNGTSTTVEPEWSAAIGRSSAASVVGMAGAPFGLPGQPASRAPSTATTAIACEARRRCIQSTAAPASSAAPARASRAIRSASRKLDKPGTRMNQVYGIRAETRRPSQLWASGTNVCRPTLSTGPSASAVPPSHSSASSQALPRCQLAIRPPTASTLSTTPNVLRFSDVVCQ